MRIILYFFYSLIIGAFLAKKETAKKHTFFIAFTVSFSALVVLDIVIGKFGIVSLPTGITLLGALVASMFISGKASSKKDNPF